MSRLTTLRHRLEAWWFDDVAIHPFVVCRIGLGLMLLHCYTVYFSERLWDVFGPNGLATFFYGTPWFATSAGTFRLSYALLLFAALCFTFGFATRISGILLIFLHHEFVQLGAMSTWGWKWEILPFLNCLVFAPSGGAYSIDAWLQKRWGSQGAIEKTSGWPLRLMQWHLAAMYAAAAWQRLDDANWLQGKMVFAAMNNLIFARFPHVDWFALKPVLEFFCHATLILEVAAPLLLWHKKGGPWIVLGLVLMHVGLEVSTMTGYWHCMLSIVLVCFLPAKFSQRLLELIPTQWSRAVWRKRRTQPG
ncbi:MAG: hypothetical protein R3B54_14140 [Bdellovibrionota bacterium]